jgi:hypothetical protein
LSWLAIEMALMRLFTELEKAEFLGEVASELVSDETPSKLGTVRIVECILVGVPPSLRVAGDARDGDGDGDSVVDFLGVVRVCVFVGVMLWDRSFCARCETLGERGSIGCLGGVEVVGGCK